MSWKPYRRERISGTNLLVLTSSDQLHLYLLFSFFTNLAMGSTVLGLPFQ